MLGNTQYCFTNNRNGTKRKERDFKEIEIKIKIIIISFRVDKYMLL
jgi:hypothetical protein